MKLLERYATACGLSATDIGEQHLLEQFYPLPFSEYITLHAASGMQGKNYPHYATVIELIKPYLAERGIEIIQLGVKEDPAFAGCYHLLGKTSLHQANYLIARSRLHIGNDSLWQHRAGYIKRPIVDLFSTTSIENHSPYDFDKEKTRFISSHRWGRNPTFAAQEPQSTANLICPFAVARAVLDLLEIPHTITQKTLNIGAAFNGPLLELIPNTVPAPQFNEHIQMVARMDLEHNENILAQVFQTGRKLNILTREPINLNLLAAVKANILSCNYEISDSTPVDYVIALKKLIPATTFFTRLTDPTALSALRFKFFDIVNIQQATDKTRNDFEKACREYTNDASFSLDAALKSGNMEFRSNKYVLSNGKIYLSHSHQKADIPVGAVGGNRVIDEDVWFHDMNHFATYTT